MKIPLRVYATRPPAPILFRHVVMAAVLPLVAYGFAYLLTLAVLCR